MKPSLAQSIVFRVPKFSYNSSLKDSWKELKAAIKISSSEFYSLIENTEAQDLDHLPDKLKFTIWKYFNRAKFRATPYGTFGGFGIFKMKENAKNSEIIVKNDFVEHSFVDWPEKENLGINLEKEVLLNNILLFSNTTFYFNTQSIRFITQNEQKVFELTEVPFQEIIVSILEFCQKPASLVSLTQFLEIKESDQAVFNELVMDMISMQMLFTSLEPNIIGEDYFKRIGHEQSTQSSYIISEAKLIKHDFNPFVLRYLPECAHFLQHINPAPQLNTLKTFAQKFSLKYEQMEIPILVALDPEFGIGYDSLEQGGSGESFITQFLNREPENQIALNKLKDYFKSKVGNKFTAESIDIHDFNLPNLKEPKPLPNTMGAMVRIVDNLVYVDSLGGISSNTLNGRFTIASEDILETTRLAASLEGNANPACLFFDVAYMSEAKVDNINRRAKIYDYSISILNFDTSEQPLSLQDIYISVKGSEVFLRSKKLNKRLIPKIASAYNYNRSDLSLFRLLCDIQNQEIQSSLSISLEELVPGENYYPELKYKNIVLSPRTWRLSGKLFKQFEPNERIEALRKYLDKVGVGRFFKAGVSDQTLCFDSFSQEDLNAFYQYALKLESLFVYEVKLPVKPFLVNENGLPLHAQFVLGLQHGNKIYNGLPASNHLIQTIQQVFIPGSEWLYFEIFCHPQRSDEILLHAIRNFLIVNEEYLKQWFFIRYNLNGSHIRLRVLLKDLNSFQTLVTSLNNALIAYVKEGYVSDVQIKTYKREIARYGHKNIEAVEKHFHIDSVYSLKLLEQNLSDIEKYNACISLLLEIEGHVFKGNDAKLFKEFIDQIAVSFQKEHHLSVHDFKILNAEQQSFSKNFDKNCLNRADIKEFLNSFKEILDNNKDLNMFYSLFHMHVNRIFKDSQRTHEMVIYYFLGKHLLRRKANLKN